MAFTILKQCFINCWLHLQSENISSVKIKPDSPTFGVVGK